MTTEITEKEITWPDVCPGDFFRWFHRSDAVYRYELVLTRPGFDGADDEACKAWDLKGGYIWMMTRERWNSWIQINHTSYTDVNFFRVIRDGESMLPVYRQWRL